MNKYFFGQIYTPEYYGLGRIITDDSIITSITLNKTPPRQEFSGGVDCIIAPGYIDLHIHGALGHDVIEGTPEAFNAISRFEASSGCTAFLPTLLSYDRKVMCAIIKDYPELSSGTSGAVPLGLNLEGPLLNREYHGAMDPRFFCNSSYDLLINMLSTGVVKFMTVAPELDCALEVIEFMHQKGIAVGFGHSGANLEEASKALVLGSANLTHTFNAMKSIHHREPGLVGLGLMASNCRASLIVDGEHLHPLIVDMIYRLKGKENTYLISDAVSGSGMEPGTYKLGAYEVIIDEFSSKLAKSKTLAGSILKMDKAIRNFISYTGAKLSDAFHIASTTPASVINDTTRGKLEIGKRGDLVILNKNLEVLHTVVGGETVYSNK